MYVKLIFLKHYFYIADFFDLQTDIRCTFAIWLYAPSQMAHVFHKHVLAQ